MPNGTDLAVTQAGRLNEMGFPEFTAKLITDTFDALIAANMRQTQAYIELIQQISKRSHNTSTTPVMISVGRS